MWRHPSKKRNFFSAFFGSPLFLSLILLCLLAAIVVPLYKNVTSRYRVDREISDLQKEISSLETGNQDLKKLLTYLESDQFAETEARLNFGFKKKGEEVVVIKEDSGLAGIEDETDGQNSDLPNPLKWFQYFLGKR